MRVISGKFKGRKLVAFEGRLIRPTSDRVRESIFDILDLEWKDKKVLDLFAGTGGLGIEALSRGAQLVVFVESNPSARRVLSRNIQKLDLWAYCELVELTVAEGITLFKRKGWRFDVIFLDPPYGRGLAVDSLRLIDEGKIVVDEGMVVVEHHYREILPDSYPGLKMIDRRRYGDTGLSFFISTSFHQAGER